ncbi:MAG: TonB-dependent receptor [Chlorobi bacterium]|nr:TonB-dependent receptor [Chlorobiota bacterium]
MKRFFLVLSFIAAAIVVMSGSIQAQRRGQAGGQGGAGSVSGTVIDGVGVDNQPLPSATVALHNAADSSLLTGAIAERNGSFSIAGIRPGHYYARFSFVGYAPRFVDLVITPASPEVSLGNIVMHPDSTIRNEVTVTVRRQFMTQAIDRTIYKTADLLVANGGTASDVLRNIPSLDVDADGKVSLRGNQNVVVHINGRPSMLSGDALAAFLRGLPADAIERVEVIPNPSAKYDPDGMSGIINIVLKQEGNRGLSGGVNTSIGTSSNYSIGGNLSYGAGPLGIFVNYGFNYGEPLSTGTRAQTNMLVSPWTYLDQSTTETSINRSHVFNGSADYAISKSQTLSFSTILNNRNNDEDNRNFYTNLDSARLVTGRYQRGSGQTNQAFSTDYRLGYKLVIEPSKHELSAEARYNGSRRERGESNMQEDISPDGSHEIGVTQRQRTDEVDRNHTVTMQIDYTRPIGANGKLEAGYKGDIESIANDFASESFDSTVGAYRPDVALTNSFIYDRKIHAVYGNYGHEIGNFAAQIGVRVEQAWTTFNLTTTKESFDNNYFSVFPSAFVTYKPVDELQIKASYSRRINRPDTRSLNPFGGYEDPLFRHIGNPQLKPEYINSVELGISHFTEKTMLSLTPFYRQTTNMIQHFSRTDTNGVTTLTFENFDVSSSSGADLVGSLKVGEWLTMLGNLSAYRIVTDASNVEVGLGNDAFGWNGRISATVEIIPGLDFQGSYNYRGPIAIEGGRIESFSMADFALQKKLFDNQGKLGLRVSDPFNTSGFNIVRTDGGFTQESRRKWASRVVYLTFNYSFGGGGARRERGGQRPSGDQDMMNME